MVDNVNIMRHKVDNVNQSGEVSPDAVIEALQAVVHASRSRHHEALKDAGADLSPLEGRVLGFFARNPGATQRELAEHSGRDKGQLARLVSGLRDKGLLETSADEADKRITRIRPSADAQRLHQSLMRQRHKLALVALEGIGEPERRQLLALLLQMRRNIHEMS